MDHISNNYNLKHIQLNELQTIKSCGCSTEAFSCHTEDGRFSHHNGIEIYFASFAISSEFSPESNLNHTRDNVCDTLVGILISYQNSRSLASKHCN